jgi:immune inhibitor A
MRQHLARSGDRHGGRLAVASCNAAALLLLLGLHAPAGAVAPPRPGTHTDPPVALEHWPDARPGTVARPHRPAPADKSATAAVAGTRRVPVLPASFADRTGAIATSALQDRFTGRASVLDYYLAASSGQLEVLGEVQGWVRAAGTVTSYARDHNGMDLWDWQHNAGWFVHDAVAAADAAGLDWGQWDNDGPDGVPNSGDDDGIVDCVIVAHAGRGGECGTGDLWSHAFFLAGWGYGAYTTRSPRHGGGMITVDDYVLVPAQGCDGGAIEIGVICHEYGHVLGLPDLYDTVGVRAGIGGWGLMGTGSWGGDGHTPEVPTLPCAWSRRELGWCEVVEVVEDGWQSLPAITTTDRVLAVRDAAMPADEVFLVENRLRTGQDASLPGEGLLIWHVDESDLATRRALNEVNAQLPLAVALEQADGLDELARTTAGDRGDAGDPWPGSSARTQFAAGTVPSSRTNAGATTAVSLRTIGTPADPVAFDLAIGVPELDRTPPVVALASPAGGEQWALGNLQTVRWTATDDDAVTTVDLHLSRDGGQTFAQLVARDLANTGQWTGSLGGGPGDALLLRVQAHDPTGNTGAAVSAPFALVDLYGPGVVLVGAPAAGTLVDPGQTVDLSWQAADNVGVTYVELQLSCDGGASWSFARFASSATSGSTTWTVPDQTCARAVLRMLARDAAGNTGAGQSAEFMIRGTTTDVADAGRLALGPCIPNPFNPRATLVYRLPAAGRVRVGVYDAAGRRLRVLVDGERPSGRHEAVWDGRDGKGRALPSGVYWVRATGPGGGALLKVTLLR